MSNKLRIRVTGKLGGVTTIIGTHDYRDFGGQGHASHLPFGAVPAPQTSTTGIGTESICFDETHGRPPYNTGGPLFIKKTIVPIGVQGRGLYRSIVGWPPPGGGTRPFDKPGCQWRATYDGGFTYGSPNVFTLPGELITSPESYDGFSNPNDMGSLGSRAYNRLRPKLSKPNLLQSLIELRETPKMLRQSASGFATAWRAANGNITGWEMAPKGAASQFLNGQFGWKPFISDINATANAVINAADYFEKLERNNNRWMKRKFAEDDIVSDQLVVSNINGNSNLCVPHFSVSTPNPWIVPNSVTHTIRRQRLTRVWYEGSFKFYRPEFDKDVAYGYPALREVDKYLTLLGLRVSPTTLYKVTPWTWLADWFVNVGDNVQRYEDALTNAVVSRYFYLMRETVDRYLIEVRWRFIESGEVSCSWTREVMVKRRVGSDDHFSFTLLPGSLSGMQLAILAALGLANA